MTTESMTIDDFELRLMEHIHGVGFALQDPEVKELFKELLGVHPDDLLEIELADLDTDLIRKVAFYIVAEEELVNNLTEDNKADTIASALTIGLFIYGWEQYNGR